MNYISEINAFYDWLETNPLSPPEIALWHGLMAIHNKTGWQQEFAAAISLVMLKTGLNAKAIERARNTLVQKGLLVYKKRGGHASGVYVIFSLCDKTASKMSRNLSVKCPTTCRTSVAQPVAQPSILLIDETKTKRCTAGAGAREDLASCCQHYESSIGTLSPYVAQSIADRLNHGAHPDLVCAAIDEACANNARTWKYIDAILSRCESAKIFTAAALRTEQRPCASSTEKTKASKQSEKTSNPFLRMVMNGELDGSSRASGNDTPRIPELSR